jgi:predicted RNA-binding Zn-ribbon protein involved in translation (DUF1610 family)
MTEYNNDDLLSVNCGSCGKSLIVRLEDIRDLRTIDCEACGKTLPTSEGATRSVFRHPHGHTTRSYRSEDVTVTRPLLGQPRTHHIAVLLEEADGVIDTAPDTVTVRISLNNVNSATGRLADAELHFAGGPLAGLKLLGFAIWNCRSRGRHVTFPARQYSADGQRRCFALLRDIPGQSGSQAIRDLILEAYAAALSAPAE